MKTFILSLFCCLLFAVARAQDPVFTSLNENFDVSCASVSGFPTYWHQITVSGDQFWQCTQGKGINNTPCMRVSDYMATSGIDTAWLVTPKLYLNNYTGSVYLNFYDRYSGAGDTLGVYIANHYSGNGNPFCDSCSWTNIVVPFSLADTTWRLHQVNLTLHKASYLYVGFKYTSSPTKENIWYIDSVYTTQVPAAVPSVAKGSMELTVLGITNADGINLECIVAKADNYRLNLTDFTGRTAMSKDVFLNTGRQHLFLNDLKLAKGMYLLRMGNDVSYGVVKVAVQ